MRKTLMTGLVFLVLNMLKGANPYRKAPLEFTKLKLSIWGLQSIKTMRLLFMSLLGVGVCLIFLMSGLVLFHVGIFLYAPWDFETKMGFTFVCAAIYIGIAVSVFFYLFSEKKWSQIFHAEGIIKNLSERNHHCSREQKTEAPL
ncbi:MAG: hypothetical protein NUV91_05290 [Candidatus Omnitrophica bacterium]|nr:hypothetical protein [Candidatus Omnitrophota bacterium]